MKAVREIIKEERGTYLLEKERKETVAKTLSSGTVRRSDQTFEIMPRRLATSQPIASSDRSVETNSDFGRV